MKATFILAALLIIVLVLTLFCIIVPLLFMVDRVTLTGTPLLFMFFACIGFGFMLVEISQMQRFNIFLGHPTYGLSVVLFSLLLSSGLGSYTTQKIDNANARDKAIIRLLFLLFALIVFGILTPYAVNLFQSSITIVRILVATVLLFPLGISMGMAFPLGMKMASAKSLSLTPWLWGINGATSVCGSVLAVAIAMNFGISTSYWTGFSFYCFSFIVILMRQTKN